MVLVGDQGVVRRQRLGKGLADLWYYIRGCGSGWHEEVLWEAG